MPEQPKSEFVRVSGLWMKEGKFGKFMSGKAMSAVPEGAKLFVFKNNNKRDDGSDCDYVLQYAADQGSPPPPKASENLREAYPQEEIPF